MSLSTPRALDAGPAAVATTAAPLLIATGTLREGALAGQVAIVTGAGGGIGFEAARALAWLGAAVVIAEINADAAIDAANRLAAEPFAPEVVAVPTDVADEASVARLVETTCARFGAIDIVVNNATFAPAGDPVTTAPVSDWDRSYAVNLRGPVLLARACLPSMLGRRRGVFVCVSSTGGPYLGAYESLKAAQVALGNTLDAELEGSGVVAFTIGPGLVPTATAVDAVERLAPKLGMTLPEFYRLNRGALLSVEAAGAGFAAAVAMAARYAGQEISSSQALVDVGIAVPDEVPLPPGASADADPTVPAPTTVSAVSVGEGDGIPPTPQALDDEVLGQCRIVRTTLEEQAAGWHERSFFERQWMLRDFKQRAGMPVERWLEGLARLERRLAAGHEQPTARDRLALERLAAFYAHLGDLARGYVKDPDERDRQVAIALGWRDDVDRLRELLGDGE